MFKDFERIGEVQFKEVDLLKIWNLYHQNHSKNTTAVFEFFKQFLGNHLEYDGIASRRTTTHWHQDCNGSTPEGKYMLVWSNRESTELRYPNAVQVFSFPPNSIVVFNNHRMEHRTPLGTTSQDRCFVRLYNPNLEAIAWFRGCRNPDCDGVASLGACAL